MAQIIELPTFTDNRGSLTILDKHLPYDIKRVYWIYDLNGESRGKHRHLESWQSIVCVRGKCEVIVKKYESIQSFILATPTQLLILEPEDWHEMRNFEDNAILLVTASRHYDPNDYVKEPLV